MLTRNIRLLGGLLLAPKGIPMRSSPMSAWTVPLAGMASPAPAIGPFTPHVYLIFNKRRQSSKHIVVVSRMLHLFHPFLPGAFSKSCTCQGQIGGWGGGGKQKNKKPFYSGLLEQYPFKKVKVINELGYES
jgi:hypothetical protein